MRGRVPPHITLREGHVDARALERFRIDARGRCLEEPLHPGSRASREEVGDHRVVLLIDDEVVGGMYSPHTAHGSSKVEYDIDTLDHTSAE